MIVPLQSGRPSCVMSEPRRESGWSSEELTMRNTLLALTVVVAGLTCLPSATSAADVHVPAQKAQSVSAAGGFAGYTDLSGT